MSTKLARTKDPPSTPAKKATAVVPPSRIDLGLPKNVIIDIIGPEHLVILEYIIEQIMQRTMVKSSLRPP